MNFDINEVIADILKKVKGIAEDDWEDIRNVVSTIMENKKSRFDLYAKRRLSGDYTQEDLEMRLDDEKEITIAELHVISIIKKAEAQKIANAAIDIVNKAIKTAIDAVI